MYSFLLKKLTATLLSFIGLLSPIFTSLSSYFFLGESFSWTLVFCTLIMLCAMWLVYYSELREGYIKRYKSLSKPINSQNDLPIEGVDVQLEAIPVVSRLRNNAYSWLSRNRKGGLYRK